MRFCKSKIAFFTFFSHPNNSDREQQQNHQENRSDVFDHSNIDKFTAEWLSVTLNLTHNIVGLDNPANQHTCKERQNRHNDIVGHIVKNI